MYSCAHSFYIVWYYFTWFCINIKGTFMSVWVRVNKGWVQIKRSRGIFHHYSLTSQMNQFFKLFFFSCKIANFVYVIENYSYISPIMTLTFSFAFFSKHYLIKSDEQEIDIIVKICCYLIVKNVDERTLIISVSASI